MNVADALRLAAERLTGVSDTPRLDAELLMAHAFGISREHMLLRHRRSIPPPAFTALVERRLAHEPIAYITGTRGFWTIELAVGPGALVPRPDSETLIEAAVAHFGRAGPARVLDLGTGPGTLLFAALAEWPEARGVGIDASPEALGWARRNAERLGLGDRADLRLGGWEGTGEAFDLILCNPPYIADGAPLPPDVREHEPASALFAGSDGLDDYRRLAPLLGLQIAPGGIACIEVGAGQAAAVSALLEGQGLQITGRADLAGHERCLVASPQRSGGGAAS